MELIKDLIEEKGVKGVTDYYAKLHNDHPNNIDIYTKYLRLLKLDAKMLGFVKRNVEEKLKDYFNGNLDEASFSVFLAEYEKVLLVYTETCLTLGYYEEGVRVLSDLKNTSLKAEFELSEHYICTENYELFKENSPKLYTDLSYVAHSHYNLRVGNYKEAERYAEEATSMDPKNVLSLLYYYIKVNDMESYNEVLNDYSAFLRFHQLRELSDYYWKVNNGFFDNYDWQKSYAKILNKINASRFSFTNSFLYKDYDISSIFSYFPEIVEGGNLTPYKSNTKDYYLIQHDESIGRVLNKEVSNLCVVTEMNRPGNIILMEPALSYKNLTFTNPHSRVRTALGSDIHRRVVKKYVS